MRHLLLSIIISVAAVATKAQHPVIQQLVDGVSIDSMMVDIRLLTGEDPVDVGAGPQRIRSRFRSNPGNALAATWLQQRLVQMGYSPSVQSFGTLGGNVLAELPGSVHPEWKVIICGHYDALPAIIEDAPAADDDGSGTIAVLEAARLMAGLSFEHSILFALWDEEEQGLVGSDHYATVASADDVVIMGVVNLDAIAYDGDGDRLMRLHVRPIANSEAIRDTVLAVNERYGIEQPIQLVQPGMTYSDHASFWSEGYGAVLIIEDFEGDGNPHYHLPTDRVEHLDTTYWRDLTRLGIATAAALAIPFDPASVGVPHEGQQPPVVAVHAAGQGHASVRLNMHGPGQVTFEVLDITGRPLGDPRSMMLAAGTQEVRLAWPAGATGIHILRCTTGDGVRTVRFAAVR